MRNTSKKRREISSRAAHVSKRANRSRASHAPINLVNDKPTELRDKIAQYLKFGVRLVWLIDPKIRQARIYRLDGSIEIVAASGKLMGEDVLPGFELLLADLFAALEPRRTMPN